MALYENNMADQAVTVGSLRVLNNIQSPEIDGINSHVNSLQQQSKAFQKEQKNYWSNLSDDGIIKPFEKTIIKKEIGEIQQSYQALFTQAEENGLEGSVYFLSFTNTYNALLSYINTTLKLFDHMQENTIIDDRETFNTYFENYYHEESFVNIALSTGIMGTLGFRVLSSLSEPGEEGEIGLYKGTIYQYTDGAWKAVGLEGYLGAMTSLPAASLNQYFLCIEDFVIPEKLIINNEELEINGEELWINRKIKYSYIYYWNGDYWECINDKTNYRYVVAMVDLVNYTGELPGAFQEAINVERDARLGQYTILNNQIVQITQDMVDKAVPVNLGKHSTPPSSAEEGDFFVYSGTTSGTWYKSDIYRWHEGNWEHLSTSDPQNRGYYMLALADILSISDAGSGYFSDIFTNSFWANNATINNMSVHTIFLRSGGGIQSDAQGYQQYTRGLRIDENGNLDANGNTHIGGTLSIAGNTNIGGTCNINGRTHITGDCTVEGIGYFTKLAFKNVVAGYSVIKHSDFVVSSNVHNLRSVKIKIQPNLINSNINLHVYLDTYGGTGGTNVHSRVYIKKNGVVQSDNYDYVYSKDFTITTPVHEKIDNWITLSSSDEDYFTILFTVSEDGSSFEYGIYDAYYEIANNNGNLLIGNFISDTKI